MLKEILSRNLRCVTGAWPYWLAPTVCALFLLFVLTLTRGATAQSSCTVTYNCQGNSGCASVMGGQVTQRTLSYPDQNACMSAAAAASAGRLPVISCNCSGGTSANPTGATTTGSLTGDTLNLGANLWIIQNVKNPYTAVFAQNFTQAFLTNVFSGDNPEARRQQQLALEAVRKQQQEAAERARLAEQQRIDAMFMRLNGEMKLSGSATQLSLKTNGQPADLRMKLGDQGSNGGLQLKMGDDSAKNESTGEAGIRGLPGIYVGGAAPAPDNSEGLKFKLDSSGSTSKSPEPAPQMGIPGLPGLNLNSVEPSQAAQLADTATSLAGPERAVVQDAALQAAQMNPALTAPSDDPFVVDYQKEAQGYQAALKEQQQALQKASESEGHVQADSAAMAYAKQIVDSPNVTDVQKQAFQQMQSAAHSDEEAAVAARQMFEQTDAHLSIVRNRASDALAQLAPAPVNLGASKGTSATTATSRATLASPDAPVISLSSKPAILATPPAVSKPYVMSVGECVASYSPTGSTPSLEELQTQLESTMTAAEQLAKSQRTANELEEDWSKELRTAHMDIFNSSTDALLDGVLDLSKTYLKDYKETYKKGLESSIKESQSLRAEYLGLAGNPAEMAAWQTKKADYLNRARIQLEQRGVLEDALAGVEKVESGLANVQTGRDFYLWLTDNEVVPCKFPADGKIDCKDLAKNNGVAKLSQGDLNTQLDLLKQVMKFGVHYSPAIKALSYGSLIGETYDIASFSIDTTYDGMAIFFSTRRLRQVKQNDAQFEKAREVLGNRMERLNAEIGCYQKK